MLLVAIPLPELLQNMAEQRLPCRRPDRPVRRQVPRARPARVECACCGLRRLFYGNKPDDLELPEGQSEHAHAHFRKLLLVGRHDAPNELIVTCNTCSGEFYNNTLFFGDKLLVVNPDLCGWTLEEAREANGTMSNYMFLRQKEDDGRFMQHRSDAANQCQYTRANKPNEEHEQEAQIMLNLRAATYGGQPIHPRDVDPGGPPLHLVIICKSHETRLLINVEEQRRRLSHSFAAMRDRTVPPGKLTDAQKPTNGSCQRIMTNISPCTSTSRLTYTNFMRLSCNDEPPTFCNSCSKRARTLLRSVKLELHTHCFPTVNPEVLKQLDAQTRSVTVDIKPLMEPEQKTSSTKANCDVELFLTKEAKD